MRQRTDRKLPWRSKGRYRIVYQRELADSSTYYVRQDQSTSEEKASATAERISMEQEEGDDETEYDESTDEEGAASEKSDDETDCGERHMSNEIDKSATFLLGRTNRYGRAVRFNSHLLF